MSVVIKYGDMINLMHERMQAWLFSQAGFNYDHPRSSGQQVVGCVNAQSKLCNWVIHPADGIRDKIVHGQPIKNGDVVRLEHHVTRRILHTHSHPSHLEANQQEISAYSGHD